MDAWLPLVGAVLGATAALAGNWMSHYFGMRRDRNQRRAEKVEEIALIAYDLRKILAERCVAMTEGNFSKEYPDAIDRLHVLVALYAPEVEDAEDEFLDVAIKYENLIDKADDLSKAGALRKDMAPEDLKVLEELSDLPEGMTKAVGKFISQLRATYKASL